MNQAMHTIKVAARITGLSPHVIRIWERRYKAVTPHRTSTQRRRYTTTELQRLTLLRQATEMGHAIGAIANLTDHELQGLVQDTRFPVSKNRLDAVVPEGQSNGQEDLEALVKTVRGMDTAAMEAAMDQAALRLGAQGVVRKLIAPLLERVGAEWEKGNLTAAHEHFASVVVGDYLRMSCRQYASVDGAPRLVVTTPLGQLHSLGASMVAAVACNLGWHVIQLGPSLPAAEIAGAAAQSNARAVALSVVYPADDERLPAELSALRRLLPADIRILAGGRAADGYAPTLKKIGARVIGNLDTLFEVLTELRGPDYREVQASAA